MRPLFLSLALPSQQVEMNFNEHCPEGSFDICYQPRIEGIPYQQGIHDYGAAQRYPLSRTLLRESQRRPPDLPRA
ncbi:hypothetical protein ACFSVK_17835 [Azorhizophilus paspali]|uniref:Uncharacterized protein n=1 Tax=Azorhizophilus paspali TaxID=69963 RepID=A0ABV6SPI0_AZOPA